MMINPNKVATCSNRICQLVDILVDPDFFHDEFSVFFSRKFFQPQTNRQPTGFGCPISQPQRGLNLMLYPGPFVGCCAAGMLSHDGRPAICQSFLNSEGDDIRN